MGQTLSSSSDSKGQFNSYDDEFINASPNLSNTPTNSEVFTFSPVHFLRSKHQSLERRHCRIPSTLDIPAPFKLQRVSKFRVLSTTISYDDNFRYAVYDFFSVVHGSFSVPPIPEGLMDVAADSVLSHLKPHLHTLFFSSSIMTNKSSSKQEEEEDNYEDEYIEKVCSFPMFAQATIVKVDVILGVMPNDQLAFYIADVSPIELHKLSFMHICYLMDMALCQRKYAHAHIKISKEIYRATLIENGRHHSHHHNNDDDCQNNHYGTNHIRVRCVYQEKDFVKCTVCQLVTIRKKILSEYDKINNNVQPNDSDDTGEDL